MEKKNSVPDIEPVSAYTTRKIKVNQYTLEGKYVKSYESITEAQKAMNPRGLSVYRAVNGALKTAYGFQWRKAN